jgi:site-specific recombinase XerD
VSRVTSRTPARQTLDHYLARRHGREEIASITAGGIRSNVGNALRLMGDPPIGQLTRAHVLAWLEETTCAPATKRTRLSQLRTFCQWAVEEGLVVRDPTAGVRGPREPRRLPRGVQRRDVNALLEACPESRARLIVLLMVQEGLRRAEVSRLQLGDIDRDERTMLVTGKGGHQRLLPISAETWRAMGSYLAERPAPNGPLIRSFVDDRSGITPTTIGHLVSDLMADAGVKATAYDGRSGHALRHTMAGDMLKGGAHIRDVQTALGHVSLMVTQRYLPLMVGDLRDAMGGRAYRHDPDAPAVDGDMRRLAAAGEALAPALRRFAIEARAAFAGFEPDGDFDEAATRVGYDALLCTVGALHDIITAATGDGEVPPGWLGEPEIRSALAAEERRRAAILSA